MEESPGDASTLIYLAKADVFDEIGSCVERILAPPSVWQESVEAGERIGAPEVGRIREAERKGLVRRVDLASEAELLAERIAGEHRLGRGESEVLALAIGSRRAIVDEGRAARVARSLGILPVSTLFLPILGYRSGAIDREQALSLARRLAMVAGATAGAVFAIEKHLKGEDP